MKINFLEKGKFQMKKNDLEVLADQLMELNKQNIIKLAGVLYKRDEDFLKNLISQLDVGRIMTRTIVAFEGAKFVYDNYCIHKIYHIESKKCDQFRMITTTLCRPAYKRKIYYKNVYPHKNFIDNNFCPECELLLKETE